MTEELKDVYLSYNDMDLITDLIEDYLYGSSVFETDIDEDLKNIYDYLVDRMGDFEIEYTEDFQEVVIEPEEEERYVYGFLITYH